jgi:hypothetical protein
MLLFSNRKVDSVDFGFSFTPARSRRSNSRTSNASNANTRRTSKTPALPSREPSVQRSRRSASRISDDGRIRRSSREVSARPEPGSTKRRRLEDIGSLEIPQTSRKISSTRRQTSGIFAIAEDAEEPAPAPEDAMDIDQESNASAPEQDTILDDNEKENNGPNELKPTKKRKKRKSIGQQAMRKKKRSSGDSIANQAPAAAQTIRAPTEETPSPPEPAEVEIPSEQLEIDGEEQEETIDPVQPAPKKRKKKKSVILVKRKRSSLGSRARQPRKQAPAPSPSLIEDGNDSDEIPDSTAGDPPSRSPSPVPRSYPIMQSIEVDYTGLDDEDEDYIDEELTPEPPTPAATKKARPTARQPELAPSRKPKSKEPKTGTKKSRFPIITHRLVNLQALPTIAEEDDSRRSHDSDDEPNPGPADKSVPRAVDVLAQICRETVETAIERLDQGNGPRAQRQRKRDALEAFGEDLDSRLFDISVAVEDRVDLEAKVRKAKREKTDLQARWIELRRERERVALKCDRLRREHWEYEHAREQRWKISEAARKVELELAKDANSGEEEEGLEFMLRSVAQEVTGAQGGGLLERMRAFNRQLEGVAEVLEGRLS